MKSKAPIAVIMVLALLAGFASAQAAFNPEKGAESPENPLHEAMIPIPDDAYDGTIGTMACVTVAGQAGIVENVTAELAVNHTWIGDLVVKVQSPTGTITTLQSRAGYTEPADDGTGCCGDSSDLATGFPLTFDDTATDSAEDMGSTIAGGDVACSADGICSYFPFPDQGPGTNLADFIGEDGAGNWMICVGDSALGDVGEIDDALTTLNIQVAALPVTDIPTLGGVGITALLSLLALGGFSLIRRRKS